MTDNDANERRQFVRVHFHANCDLINADTTYHTELLDISFKGLLVRSDEMSELPLQSLVAVKIFLTETDIVLEASARLTRIHSPFYGLVIESIELESLTHLRRLVELNLGDSSLFERELEQLSHGDHKFPD